MGLAELSTARFIELSPCAAEMLGTTVEDGIGLSYLAVVEPPSAAAESFRLAGAGIIDGTRTRRRIRRPDGSTVDVHATGWAIRSPAGPDLGLWMASEVLSGEHASVAEEVVAPSFPRQRHSDFRGDRVTLDDRWRVTEVRSSADSLLGRPLEELLASSFIELTHPDDLAALLFALARATTDVSAQALVRLRHRDGTWRVIQATPKILEGEGKTPVAFVLGAETHDRTSPAPSGAVSEVPAFLRRIADQIEAAGVLAPLVETADALGVATTTDLSPRQWEIVSRLLRGERVATIAAGMYLSRSTIRNHLSAVFAKVGVHSQEELLALYRNERRSGPSDRR
jgi:DNA-binding CsgD family transcriptional regulator/PAS domain-containing protein